LFQEIVTEKEMFKAGYLLKIFTALAIILALIPSMHAQQTKPAVRQAPVPSQVLSAKKVFIAYAGGDSNSAGYSGDVNRTYNQFYAAIKDWGEYEIVSAPANADLVLKINFDSGGATSITPRFTLDIRDPRSNVLLWRLRQNLQFAH
jgi:hypothetical protein